MIIEREEWRENDLYFDFSKAVSVIKLDSLEHGLSHHMKAVDFVVEWQNQYWLIEVKDPENSTIPQEKRINSMNSFSDKMLSGSIMKQHLSPKFRDSLVYLGLDRGIPSKSMRYYALIGIESLDPLMLNSLADTFRQQDPVICGPKKGWTKSFEFRIFNIALWNKYMPNCPVFRVGAGFLNQTTTSMNGSTAINKNLA
ncbi:MAG: hypothetical protein HQL93_04685 [Magnetococcales bacterium]|nr:hypothetical protein [Magnetococcales bacterium]